MIQDVALPVQFSGKDRNEVFIVYFDGFIKNTSAGIVRTMIRDIDKWIKKYPLLNVFEGLTRDELYETTMLTMPTELLYELSDEKISLDEIQSDLKKILPNIILSNSHYTTFEFALYQLLKDDKVKECYIFRDIGFFDNEIKYINQMYKDVLYKIHIISGGFLTLFKEKNPTTCFINYHFIISDHIVKEFTPKELDKKLFIILNTFYNIQYNETTNVYEYTEEFANTMDEYVKNKTFGMTAMFNFQLNSQETDDRIEEERNGQPVHHLTADEVDEQIRLMEGEL